MVPTGPGHRSRHRSDETWSGQKSEESLQGFQATEGSALTQSARLPLAELVRSSEYQRYGTGSVGLHRSTFSLCSIPKVRVGSWRLPATALVDTADAIPTRSSLVNFPSPTEFSASELLRLLAARKPRIDKASPPEVSGPFSTSSRWDSPTRGSMPAVVRLRRFSDLDGLLPLRPCRLVSFGGTHGVPSSGSLQPPASEKAFAAERGASLSREPAETDVAHLQGLPS